MSRCSVMKEDTAEEADSYKENTVTERMRMRTREREILQTHSVTHYKNLSMLDVSVVLGTAPMIVSFFSPLMKIMIVGMLLTLYWLGVEGDSSVFSL